MSKFEYDYGDTDFQLVATQEEAEFTFTDVDYVAMRWFCVGLREKVL